MELESIKIRLDQFLEYFSQERFSEEDGKEFFGYNSIFFDVGTYVLGMWVGITWE